MPFSDQYVGISDAEGTWGTEANRAEWHRIYPGSFLRHERNSRTYGYLGQGRAPGAVFYGFDSGTGKIRVPLVYKAGTDTRHLMRFVFGAAPTGTGPYTFKLGSSVASGQSIELHMGLPDASLESFLAEGAKCSGFGVNFAVGEEVVLDVDLTAELVKQDAKSTPGTYPTYPTNIVHPTQVTVAVDGGAFPVRACSFQVLHALLTDRAFLGSSSIGEQQFATGFREVTGELVTEWSTSPTPTSKTLYDKFLSGAAATIVVTCDGPGSLGQVWTFSNVYFTGQTPEPGEGGIAEQRLPFTSLDHADTEVKLVQTEA